MYIVKIIHILIKTLYINRNKSISIFIILNLFKIGILILVYKKKKNQYFANIKINSIFYLTRIVFLIFNCNLRISFYLSIL